MRIAQRSADHPYEHTTNGHTREESPRMRRARKVGWMRLLLIATVLFVATLFFLTQFVFVHSREATINAEILSLRTPIDGEIYMGSDVKTGFVLPAAMPVFTVENKRFGNMESLSQINGLQNELDMTKLELTEALILRHLRSQRYARMRKLVVRGNVPRKELDEARNDFDRTQATILMKRQQVEHLNERFLLMQDQFDLQKSAVLSSPSSGIVWATQHRRGEYVSAGDEVVQLLRPEDVFVDAFFSERHAAKLKAGMKVRVQELGSARHWEGRIETLRAGVGRTTYGAPVAVPPQKLKEKLVAAKIRVEWGQAFTPEEFYGVGRSVEVAV